MTSTFRSEARALVELAIPLIGVNLGISAMGLVDTAMIGRTDAVQLSAVALGSLYFFWLTQFGMGVLYALDPIVAQAHAAGRQADVRAGVRRQVQPGSDRPAQACPVRAPPHPPSPSSWRG